jgi:hypothetical protein
MQSAGLRVAFLGAIVGALLGGCVLSVKGAFSPVRGPLAGQKPVPSFPAQLSGAFSGTISVTLPGAGICRGNWSLAGPQAQNFDLSADWDQVYGAGYYSAHVLGDKEFVRTALNCSAGGVIRTEFSNENNKPGNTHGVAEDDHGNLFKISVYN